MSKHKVNTRITHTKSINHNIAASLVIPQDKAHMW